MVSYGTDNGSEMVSYGTDNSNEMVSFYTDSDSGDVLQSWSSSMMFSLIYGKKIPNHAGIWIHNHQVANSALYQLSHAASLTNEL